MLPFCDDELSQSFSNTAVVRELFHNMTGFFVSPLRKPFRESTGSEIRLFHCYQRVSIMIYGIWMLTKTVLYRYPTASSYTCLLKFGNAVAVARLAFRMLTFTKYISTTPEPVSQTMNWKVSQHSHYIAQWLEHYACMWSRGRGFPVPGGARVLFSIVSRTSRSKWVLLPDHGWHFVYQPLQTKYPLGDNISQCGSSGIPMYS